MNKERIRTAVDALKNQNKHLFVSQQDICYYTNELTKNNMFLESKYNRLKGISPVDLSRALSGSLSQSKLQQVLNVVDAMLIDFVGMEYDEKIKEYVFSGGEQRPFPYLMEKETELGQGLKFYDKIPSDSIKRKARGARKIFIIQSLLAGWGRMEDTFAEAIEQGCEEIKILLVKPYTEAAYTRGKSLEHNPESFIDDLIKSSIIKITRIMKTLNEEQQAVIQLKFYESSPATPLFWIVRDDGVEEMYYGFYFYGQTALSAPWFRLRHSKLSLAKRLKKHFQNLWSSGERFPLDGNGFDSYISELAERAKMACFTPKKRKISTNVFFKVFYFRNNDVVSFRMIIDKANEIVEIDKTPSGVDYSGLVKELANNLNIIAHTKYGSSSRIMHLLFYKGLAEIDSRDTFFGFYMNLSHEYGLPHSNGVLVRKYDPAVESYSEVNLKEPYPDSKMLANFIQNIPKKFVIPWDDPKEKRKYKEGLPEYLFYSACYFAAKNETATAQELLKKAFHNGFDNLEIFNEELKNGTFGDFSEEIMNPIRKHFV